MPVLIRDKAAVGVCDLELHTGQRFTGQFILLLNDQRTGPLVLKCKLLFLSGLDLNVLGRAVKNEPIHRLDFSGGNGRTGFQILQHDLARIIGIIDAIVRTDSRAAAVHHPERHAGERFIGGAADELPDDEGGGGIILKPCVDKKDTRQKWQNKMQVCGK